MKALNYEQIQNIKGGGLDCSDAGIASFIGGAAAGGAIFFGWGGLVSGVAAWAYIVDYCFSGQIKASR